MMKRLLGCHALLWGLILCFCFGLVPIRAVELASALAGTPAAASDISFPNGFKVETQDFSLIFTIEYGNAASYPITHLSKGLILGASKGRRSSDGFFQYYLRYRYKGMQGRTLKYKDTLTAPSGKKKSKSYKFMIDNNDTSFLFTNSVFRYFYKIKPKNVEIGTYQYECFIDGHCVFSFNFEVVDDDRIFAVTTKATDLCELSKDKVQSLGSIPDVTTLEITSLEGVKIGDLVYYSVKLDDQEGYVRGSDLRPIVDETLLQLISEP